VVERCRKEGSPDGVYLYHAADMSDPLSAVELIEVIICVDVHIQGSSKENVSPDKVQFLDNHWIFFYQNFRI